MRSLSHSLSNNLLNTESFSAYFEPIIQLIKPSRRFKSLNSKVTNVSWNNQNTYTIRIVPSRKWQGFQAGQFVELTVEKDGAYLTRCFSISSTPKEFRDRGYIELTIRAHKEGAITPWLVDNLKKGSRVYLSQAQGEFLFQDTTNKKLFLAGGSGVTPIMSMLRENQNASWLKDATLLFYIRSEEGRFFERELKSLAEQGLTYHFVDSSAEGRLSQDHLTQYCSDLENRDVYVCGPGGMIEHAKTLCEQAGLNPSQIHFEYFGQNTSFNFDPDTLSDEPIFIDYQRSLKKNEGIQPKDKMTLLQIAESEGLKPVSGCRIGVCHQCICKKKQGRVFNTKTKQISDTGEEEIQLCLSVPLDPVTLEL